MKRTLLHAATLICTTVTSMTHAHAQQLECMDLTGFGTDSAWVVQGKWMDETGNLFVSGYFTGTVNLGSLSLTSTGNGGDRLIARMNPDGQWAWAEKISQTGPGCGGFFMGGDVHPAGPGLIWLTMYDACTFTFSDDPTEYAGGSGFMTLTTEGEFVEFNPVLPQESYEMGLTGSAGPNAMVFSGWNGQTVYGQDTIMVEYNAPFVASADSNGSWSWGMSLGTHMDVTLEGLATSPNGLVAVWGSLTTDSAVHFGSTSTSTTIGPNGQSDDGYIGMISAEGEPLFFRRISDEGYPWRGNTYNAAFADDGSLVVCGGVEGGARLGPAQFSDWAGFIGRLDASGQWTEAWNMPENIWWANDMEVLGCGGVILAGTTGEYELNLSDGTQVQPMSMAVGTWSRTGVLQDAMAINTSIWDSAYVSVSAPMLFPGTDGAFWLTAGYLEQVEIEGNQLSATNGLDDWRARLSLGCMAVSAQVNSDESCLPGDDGSISLCVSDGAGPFTYQWSNGATTSDLVGVGPGTYSVLVTDAEGCAQEATTTVPGPSSDDQTDLATAVVSIGAYRPGMSVSVPLSAWNDGCQPADAEVTLVFSGPVQFQSATPPPDGIAGDSLWWSTWSLTYNGGVFQPMVHLITDVSATIGDQVCLTSSVSSLEADLDGSNNTYTACYAVVNSYDPNDKAVSPLGEGPLGVVPVDQRLTYTIRFQNTGTAEAMSVIVTDELDPALDVSTFELLSTSHAATVEIRPGSELVFHFPSIHLPDSTSDEPGSHGYVVFSCAPVAGLPIGTQVENEARIYFDYNAPIITNTVLNTWGDPLSVVEHPVDAIEVYPNPANDLISLSLKARSIGSPLFIRDLQGRVLLTRRMERSVEEIDIAHLAPGVYSISCGQGRTAFIKH